MLLSPILAPIALTVGEFYDVLAGMLDFNFSKNFKVRDHIQNKSTQIVSLF